MPKGFQFCDVCKRNHEEGSRHVHSKKHQAKLAKVLQNDQRRVDDIRYFAKVPTAKEPSSKDATPFWCRFCEVEVKEGPSLYRCVRHIQHLASWEHNTRVWDFWTAQNAPKDLRDKFMIPKEEYEEFIAAIGVDGLRDREDGAEPPPAAAPMQGSPSEPAEGASAAPAAKGAQASRGGRKHRAPVDGAKAQRGGNVHTGAIPPWMMDDDDDDEEEEAGPPQPVPPAIPGPPLPGAKRKAEEEEEDGYGEDWLPSFGRVFNDGARSATLREFRSELASHKGRRGDRPAAAPPPTARQTRAREAAAVFGGAWSEQEAAAAPSAEPWQWPADGAAAGQAEPWPSGMEPAWAAEGPPAEEEAPQVVLYHNPREPSDEPEPIAPAAPPPLSPPPPAPPPAAAEPPPDVEAQDAAIERSKAALRERLRAARGGGGPRPPPAPPAGGRT